MKTCIIGVSLLLSTAAFASDPLMPSGGDDTAAIQNAIDTAPEGGTVTLGDGEFLITEQISIAKELTLTSANGRGKTTIRQTRTALPDGVTSSANRVLYLNHAKAKVVGLKLTGGKALGTAVTASNGAGVKIDTLGGQLVSCDVCGNTLLSGVNYVVDMASDDAVLSNCWVRANGTTGGNSNCTGVYATKGLVTHSDIFCNTNTTSANGDCSGVWLAGTTRLTHCAVSNNVYGVNSRGSKSSALYVGGTGVRVDNCLVANNWSGVSCRGTVYFTGGMVSNCTVVGNYMKSGNGAGVYFDSSNTILYGGVIAGNLVDRTPSGVYRAGGNYITVSRCVSDVAFPESSGMTVSDCDVGDVRFNADYSLAFDSIGFNICPPSDYGDLSSMTDLAGRPRLSGTGVEAGCFEYQLGDYEPLIRISAEELPENTKLTAAVTDMPGFAGSIEYAWGIDDGAVTAWSSEKSAAFTVMGVGAHMLNLHVRIDGVEVAKVFPTPFRVSQQYINITSTDADLQAAIDSAGVGTTIVLDDGEYPVLSELVIRKPIVFKSKNGAARTILRQAQTTCPEGVSGMQARVLVLGDLDAVVDGFTITGGNWIGTALKSGASQEYGSAVRIESPGGSLINCWVVGNTIGSNQQAGIYISSRDALVSNCLIRANNTTGGNSNYPALYAEGGLITHSDISCNTNSTSANGVGIGARLQGYACMSHCTLTNNVYMDRGGKEDAAALSVGSTLTTVDNCLIVNNRSETPNGKCSGLYMTAGKVIHCTITGNSTKASTCSGIWCQSGGNEVEIRGCIVSGNTAGVPDQADWHLGNTPSKLTVVRSMAPYGFTGANTISGCLTATAVFEDAENGNYVLSLKSDGRDCCPPSEYTAEFLAAGDLAGNDRLSGDAVDMGAYERQQAAIEIALVGDDVKTVVGGTITCTATITGSSAAGALCAWSVDGGTQTEWDEGRTYVYSPSAAGVHTVRLFVKLTDGTVLGPYEWSVWGAPEEVFVAQSGNEPELPYADWQTAATNIADAIAVSAGGTTITVGDGLYEIDEQLVLDRGIVLRSANGAAVTEIRNTAKIVDVPNRLVLLNNANARCEGFTLSNGYAANSGAAEMSLRGAGVRVGENGGTLSSCVITNCLVGGSNQGTIALCGPLAVVSNCTISANTYPGSYATWVYGIGVWMSAGLVVDCRITDNRSYLFGNERWGGSVCITGGRMSRCVIANNTETGSNGAEYPGAVFINGASSQIDNCLVADNDGRKCSGAGIYANNGTILNCTVVGNTGFYNAAGIHAGNSAVRIVNCIVQDNLFRTGSESVTTNISGSASVIAHCLSPDFTSAESGNVPGAVRFRRGYRPRTTSASIDAGISEGWDVGAYDLLGGARIRGKEVDIGCHEVDPSGLMLLVK